MHKIETKQLAINDALIFVTEFDALFDIITADWSEIYVTFSLEWQGNWCAKSIWYLNDKPVLNSVIIIFWKQKKKKKSKTIGEGPWVNTGVQVFAAMI